jgi:ubiquinone biosynthesis monooxygenase Coq7
MRSYTLVDQVIIQLANCLTRFCGPSQNKTTSHSTHPAYSSASSPHSRHNPSDGLPEVPLSPAEANTSIQLMRVNHAGEVCAQALYQGQALMAKQPTIKAHLKQAAKEEADHLAWCAGRIHALGGKTSRLNPLWYTGSLLIGMIAGLSGDKISLGFLAETEQQVTAHLQGHLQKLPTADRKSHAILTQMQTDEQTHAQLALEKGGGNLPFGIPTLMRLSAKIMTTLAFYI